MTDIKQFVTPDNLGPDFEQDATAKEIKVNIDGVTVIRNAEGKLEAVGGGGDSVVYNITELPEGAPAPVATRDNALAAGSGARASGPNATAIGNAANASSTSSVAIGNGATSFDEDATAIGNAAKASSRPSVAIGGKAEARDRYSTALGYGAKTSKEGQVSIAALDISTHLAASPYLLSGVKTPEVGQDAANKDYVDDLTKVDGTTITRNAEGELEVVGGGGDGADCCEPLTPQLELSSDLYIEDGRLKKVYDGLQHFVIPVGRQVKLLPQTITGVVDGEDVEITINADLSWSCNLPVEGEGCAPLEVNLSFQGTVITTEGFLAGEYSAYLELDCPNVQ